MLLMNDPSLVADDDDDAAPSAARAFSSKQPKRVPIGAKKRAKNSALAVGYKDDLSFVVQGDMIGVFRQQRDGGKKVSLVSLAGVMRLLNRLPFLPSHSSSS